jgi:hypothetical protein
MSSSIDEKQLYRQLTRERLRYEAESKDPYKAIDDLIECVIFQELAKKDLQRSLQLANNEISRLTDLVNRDSWAPLDVVAGGPGSPGYDDVPYIEPMGNSSDITPDPIFGEQANIPPVIEEWRLPEKDR